jgi:predicted TIM-barrel fold metal-dependent hydrolase
MKQLKIDAYSHIVPAKYKEALYKVAPKDCDRKVSRVPALYDVERRFRIMDKYEEVVQVLTLAWPAVEEIADSEKAVDLARLANDEMAELVFRYPDRFVAAIACLPMNNIDAALKEVDRAINDLRFRGVQVYTPINDKPLDALEFMPLYEKMSQYNLPILIHPMRSPDYPDYRTEAASKYGIYSIFAWPYETTIAMTRLVFSGVLERYSNLKMVTHHCGGMVPYFEQRIKVFHDLFEMLGYKYKLGLTKAPIDYFKMFYSDTAIQGNTPALMCAYAFCGPDHLLFGADMPLGDSQLGYRNYGLTISAIKQMNISDVEKTKIFEENARKLFQLPI